MATTFPLSVVPGSGPNAGLPVLTCDTSGNLTIAGVLLLSEQAAAPLTQAGVTAVYADGNGAINFVGPNGSVVAVNISGKTVITGNLTVTGEILDDAAGTSAVAFAVNVPSVGAFDTWRVGGDGTQTFGPGTASRDTTLARTAVGVLSVTQGSFSVTTAGQGLAVKEGSNAKQGTAILAGGTAVVANTSVTANSRIQVTSQVDGGTPGFLRVSTRTAGTSFTITSSSGTDTSTVAYEIFEPA